MTTQQPPTKQKRTSKKALSFARHGPHGPHEPVPPLHQRIQQSTSKMRRTKIQKAFFYLATRPKTKDAVKCRRNCTFSCKGDPPGSFVAGNHRQLEQKKRQRLSRQNKTRHTQKTAARGHLTAWLAWRGSRDPTRDGRRYTDEYTAPTKRLRL